MLKMRINLEWRRHEDRDGRLYMEDIRDGQNLDASCTESIRWRRDGRRAPRWWNSTRGGGR